MSRILFRTADGKYIDISKNPYNSMNEDLEKGAKSPIGAVATWSDGKQYRKVSEDTWEQDKSGSKPHSSTPSGGNKGGDEKKEAITPSKLHDKFTDYLQGMNDEHRAIFRGGTMNFEKKEFIAPNKKLALVYHDGKVTLGKVHEMEKARITKYIKRLPHPSGKGYIYFYTREQVAEYKKSGKIPEQKSGEHKDSSDMLKSIMNFFGLSAGETREKLDKDFKKHEDKLKGVSLASFIDHVGEYLTNKDKWDAKIAGKPAGGGGEKKPSTPKEPKATGGEKKSGGSKFNLSIMKTIAGIYGGKKEEKKPYVDDRLEAEEKAQKVKDAKDNFDTMPESMTKLSDANYKSLKQDIDNLPDSEDKKNLQSILERLKKDAPNMQVQHISDSVADLRDSIKEYSKPTATEALKEELGKKESGKLIDDETSTGTGIKDIFKHFTPKTQSSYIKQSSKLENRIGDIVRSKEFEDIGAWSNGNVLVSDPEFSKKIYDAMKKDKVTTSEGRLNGTAESMVDQIMKPAVNHSQKNPANILGHIPSDKSSDNGSDHFNKVILQKFDGEQCAINADLINFFETQYKNSNITYHPQEGSMTSVLVRVNDKPVGVIMPMSLPKAGHKYSEVSEFVSTGTASKKPNPLTESRSATISLENEGKDIKGEIPLPENELSKKYKSVRFYQEQMRDQLNDTIKVQRERGTSEELIKKAIESSDKQALNYATQLKGYIDDKDYGKLSSILHTGNSSSRRMFVEITGVELGKTNASTTEALKKYCGDKADKHIAEDKEKSENQAKVQKEAKELAEKEKYAPIGTFADTLSGKEKGLALKVLTNRRSVDNKIKPLHEHVETILKNGGSVQKYAGKEYIHEKDGSFYDTLPKIAVEYAKHLERESGSRTKEHDEADKKESEYNKTLKPFEDKIKALKKTLYDDQYAPLNKKMEAQKQLIQAESDLEEFKKEHPLTKATQALREELMFKAEGGEKGGHKYVKRMPSPSGKGYIYFYNQAQVKEFQKNGTIPKQGKEKEGMLKPDQGKDKKEMLKNALKKIGTILADALSGKDAVQPAGAAVEGAGEDLHQKGKYAEKKAEINKIKKENDKRNKK